MCLGKAVVYRFCWHRVNRINACMLVGSELGGMLGRLCGTAWMRFATELGVLFGHKSERGEGAGRMQNGGDSSLLHCRGSKRWLGAAPSNRGVSQ